MCVHNSSEEGDTYSYLLDSRWRFSECRIVSSAMQENYVTCILGVVNKRGKRFDLNEANYLKIKFNVIDFFLNSILDK